MENHRQRFLHNKKNIFVKSKDYVLGLIIGLYAFFALFFKSLIYSDSSINRSTSNQYRGEGRSNGNNSGPPEKFGGGCFNLKGMGGG